MAFQLIVKPQAQRDSSPALSFTKNCQVMLNRAASTAFGPAQAGVIVLLDPEQKHLMIRSVGEKLPKGVTPDAVFRVGVTKNNTAFFSVGSALAQVGLVRGTTWRIPIISIKTGEVLADVGAMVQRTGQRKRKLVQSE